MKKDKLHILLAEDDPNLGNILKTYLDAKGYPTTLCVNGQEAYEAFLRGQFGFCILDVMMPLKDGFSLAKDIRKANKKVPILFLTAKTMQEDILEGLSLGADDYMTKPFHMEELLLRIHAIARRSLGGQAGESEKTLFRIGSYTFDYTRHVLRSGEDEQKLTSKEAQLLKMLCDRLNDVLERSEALNKIWYDDNYFNARSMDVYIAKLRKYLKEDDAVELLNVHGRGFKLVAPETA